LSRPLFGVTTLPFCVRKKWSHRMTPIQKSFHFTCLASNDIGVGIAALIGAVVILESLDANWDSRLCA
jgi:hypothetical protein